MASRLETLRVPAVESRVGADVYRNSTVELSPGKSTEKGSWLNTLGACGNAIFD